MYVTKFSTITLYFTELYVSKSANTFLTVYILTYGNRGCPAETDHKVGTFGVLSENQTLDMKLGN